MLAWILTGLFVFVWALGGFISAQIAQRIFVPLLVWLLGEKRFASPSAFDGCTLGLVGAFIAFVGPAFLYKRHWSGAWIFAIIFVGVSLYGLLWLWCLGRDGRNREWNLESNTIIARDGRVLTPTFARERQDYTQTDAFNGYSHYFLELYDDAGKLATNSYNVEEIFEAELDAVRTLFPQLRTLDLRLVARVEPLKWRVAQFSDVWTPLLCGSLDRLSDEDRLWWRPWCEPNFAGQETPVEALEWTQQLARLRAVYPDYPPAPKDEFDWPSKSDEFQFNATLSQLEKLFAAPEPISAMNCAVYEQAMQIAIGDLPKRSVHAEEFLYLGDRYDQELKRAK